MFDTVVQLVEQPTFARLVASANLVSVKNINVKRFRGITKVTHQTVNLQVVGLNPIGTVNKI